MLPLPICDTQDIFMWSLVRAIECEMYRKSTSSRQERGQQCPRQASILGLFVRADSAPVSVCLWLFEVRPLSWKFRLLLSLLVYFEHDLPFCGVELVAKSYYSHPHYCCWQLQEYVRHDHILPTDPWTADVPETALERFAPYPHTCSISLCSAHREWRKLSAKEHTLIREYEIK